MKNIVLAGFMATGKTSVGAELVTLTGRKLLDTDEEIVRTTEMQISEIFATRGEPEFRRIETEVITEICKGKKLIISTGGGAVLKQENLDALRLTGIVFCLTAKTATILKRTSGDFSRPLLQVDDPEAKVNELLSQRKPFYDKCDYQVSTDCMTPGQVAQEILKIMKDERAL